MLHRLKQIERDWLDCQDCNLHKKRSQLVHKRILGKPTFGCLLVIGEAPGRSEDSEGVPFVGRAGKLLDKLFARASIDSCVIVNVVACRPPGNRDPGQEEMKACWARVQRVIEVVQPKAIVTLGRVAPNWIFDQDSSMNDMTEKVFVWWFQGNDIPVVPAFHPAYLLRGKRSKKADQMVVNALEVAQGLVEKRKG